MKLEPCESCHWCAPQECFAASLWWGDCLINFYSKLAARLEAERLNETALECLRLASEKLRHGSAEILDPETLWPLLGNCGTLDCFWVDYMPPVVRAASSRVAIPVEESTCKT